jgi:hypothetical protein
MSIPSLSIKQLLDLIKTYYPINSEIPKEEYVGYQILTKLVEDKMKLVINNKLPLNVTNLLNGLKSYFNAFEIIDEFHLQFPSYSISIKLKEQKVEYVKLISFIRIKISLISSHFTVFYEEMSFYENFSKFRPIAFRILSSKNGNLDSEKDYFNTIILLMSRHFAEYEYVNHQMLFLNKLSNAVPYNYEKGNHFKEYPLYDFLFDDEYHWGNLEVTF